MTEDNVSVSRLRRLRASALDESKRFLITSWWDCGTGIRSRRAFLRWAEGV
jgi:hypothetical protein